MNKERLGRGGPFSMCIIIWSCYSNCCHTSHSITPGQKETARSRKDSLELSVPPCLWSCKGNILTRHWHLAALSSSLKYGEGLVLWLSTKWELRFFTIFQAGGIMCQQAIYAGRPEQKQEKRGRQKAKKTSFLKVPDFFRNIQNRKRHPLLVCVHFLNPFKALIKNKTWCC